MKTLYHYTCIDGRHGIGDEGLLRGRTRKRGKLMPTTYDQAFAETGIAIENVETGEFLDSRVINAAVAEADEAELGGWTPRRRTPSLAFRDEPTPVFDALLTEFALPDPTDWLERRELLDTDLDVLDAERWLLAGFGAAAVKAVTA